MFSQLVPFPSVIENIKDTVDFTVTQNMYPRIRRLIYRAEKAIGFGGSVMLRRVKYTKESGTLISIGERYKLRLPSDVIKLEAIGMCKEGICPGMYRIQGDWLFFCEGFEADSVSLIYYTLISDGEGNPVVSENHLEAVIAGVVFWLYKANLFSHKANGNTLQYYENDFDNRIGEARGDDAMPDTDEEWSKIARLLNSSTREAIMYSHIDNCFCDIPEDIIAAPMETKPTGGGGGYTKDLLSTNEGVHRSGTGSGGDETGDGSYRDPNAPVDPVDPEPLPENEPPTIEDITLTVPVGEETVLDLEVVEGIAGSPYSDPENDALAELRIDAISPNNSGTFFKNGIPVQPLMTFTRQELIDGFFTHVGGGDGEFTTDRVSFSVRDGVNNEWVS